MAAADFIQILDFRSIYIIIQILDLFFIIIIQILGELLRTSSCKAGLILLNRLPQTTPM